MDSVPLIPKSKASRGSDVSPLIRQFFQQEIESAIRGGPTKKFSQTIVTSLQYNHSSDDERDGTKTAESLENLLRKRKSLLSFSENVFKAYVEHETESDSIRQAEKNLFEAHAQYLKREAILLGNKTFQDLYSLKRQPHLKALDVNHVKKYNLLEGEAGLPPSYQTRLDFRIDNFGKWKKRLESLSQDSLLMNYMARETVTSLANAQPTACYLNVNDPKPEKKEAEKIRKPRPRGVKINNKPTEVFRAEPRIVFFTGYKPGEIYTASIEVKNIHTKGMLFQVKPTSPHGPFHVCMKSCMTSKKLYPGLSFELVVEFAPKSLDVVAEDVYVAIEEDNKLLIPLVAYLEPPILKTHKDLNEFTKLTVEKISSSFIECGTCFTGDSKVTKIKFKCYRGSGEFFVMSSENWNRSHVNSVTNDNFLEIPPFRVYPVYFKLDKNEVIDLFVEFSPKNSGTHVENVMLACDNGEVRSLDLLGDAIGWHSYFFSFQDDLTKELPVDSDDDPRVKYYIDFGEATPTGKLKRSFLVRNNSNMPFEYQWKTRELNSTSQQQKFLKLSRHQLKIEPENGTLEPSQVCQFDVSIAFDHAPIGQYGMVLSLYVLNLPYQCIEEDSTIIQPTGLVRNLYSQSLYGEQEFTTPSPELLSLQGTYESLQESIKSYVEYQTRVHPYPKNDFCRTICIPNPGLCAKPLKKSKTLFNIGEDEGLTCACRGNLRPEDSISDSCTSNEKTVPENGPKNEVIWDFVDVLVDEVELWAEVGPVRVTLEPAAIQFPDFPAFLDSAVSERVRIINHSQSSAKCQWLMPDNVNLSVSIICRHADDSDCDDHQNSSLGENSSEGFSATFSHRETQKTIHDDLFEIPGFSEIVCTVRVVANRPGKFSQIILLSVDEGSSQLTLLVSGNATGRYFSAGPRLIDFRFIKRGTRTSRPYEIRNEFPHPVNVMTNQYDFDLVEESSTVRFTKTGQKFQFRLEENNSTTKSFYLDARKAGFKCSILEISAWGTRNELLETQYILALGDVKVPSLNLKSSRFDNAILAPSGMMYVGETIRSRVTLKNKGKVNAVFEWGPPFGCHSRKINVVVNPKKGKINSREKLLLEVVLTPLDEGILDHCYVPCYFCRASKPLILSIVGIIGKIKVTFEILDSKTSGTTAVRIPWPINNYDPNLGETYRKEEEVLNMKCRCFQVEEEANRAFGSSFEPQDSPSVDRPAESGITHRENETLSSGQSKEKNTNKVSEEENFIRSFASDRKNPAGNENAYSVEKYVSRESLVGGLKSNKAELEFLNVPCNTPVVKEFVVRNETPVKTTFRIAVQNYGKAETFPENSILAIKEKILGRDSVSKDKREKRQGPLLLEVNPSTGELLGRECVCVSVTATGNTWGEYRDVIICQVAGIRPFNLKVFVQLVGHPFYFPMFENHPSVKPALRFEPVSQASGPTRKKIRVVNRTAVPITVSWLIFMTQPFTREEDHEDSSLNLGLESNGNLDSNHSEDSNKSLKVYIPKNISESASTFRNMLEMRDFSQNSGTFDSFGKGESLSDKNENQETFDAGEKIRQDGLVSSPTEIASESQQFMFRIDIHNFRVDPKELSFEPFEEKKITVTFDPRFCKIKDPSQEFRAVLTGCVKLKPSDEKCPGLFFRPTGMNFLFKIMDFNALLETSLLSIELLKGDLKFHVDANDVIKSHAKTITMIRKYFFKNKNQSSIDLKIEISPGSIFRVRKIETLDEIHPKYNPEKSNFAVKTGQCFQLELECSVTYKGVVYAYEQLNLNRKKERDASCSDDIKTFNNSSEEKCTGTTEPWRRYFNPGTTPWPPATPATSTVEPRDSFNINLNRMSSKSDSSICYDYSGANYYRETEGETVGLLPPSEDSPRKSKVFQHIIVVEEEINFVQAGLATQTVFAELHLSFPILRVSPEFLDMGNVYIGETAVRYCSLINLTGFPTDFKFKSKCNVDEFAVEPIAGNVPSANYNLDIGTTVTVRFVPKEPGHFVETYQVYCNAAMEFDFTELSVSGIGTWNEKYKKIKFETDPRIRSLYPCLEKAKPSEN